MIKIKWLGAAGLEFFFDGKTILVDPFLSRNTFKELNAGPLESKADLVRAYMDELRGPIAAILMGHTHYDHALDIPVMAKQYDGPLIGSRSFDTLMSLHSMPGRVTVCEGGEQVPLMPDASATMLLSKHGIIGDSVPSPGEIDPEKIPPLSVGDYRLGTIFMLKLALGQTSFMMAGSANFRPEQLAGHTCDVLFMCVAGWEKTPAYASELPGLVRPDVIVPYHSDNFFVPLPPNRKAPLLPGLNMAGFFETVSKSAPNAEIRKIDTFHVTEF